MVNNEFHVIGVATSNYQDISNPTSNFKKHRFSIEIEKRGSKQGNTMLLNIEVYDTNRAINTNEDIMGRKIAVSGYIDSYMTKNGDEPVMKVVAQSVLLLDDKVQKQFDTAPTGEKQPKEEIEQVVESIADIPDDDLPF